MRLQFKIKLRGIQKPPVWRRVSVPAEISFELFSEVIQYAFMWYGAHLWHFTPQGYGSNPVIATPHPECDLEFDLNAATTKLSERFKAKGDKMVYIYDFGDDWTHEILLEEISDDNSKMLLLLGAKGATPPEDCGGIWGFEHFKEVIQDPKHKEYKQLCRWIGMDPINEEWDPKFADVELGEIEL